MLSETALVAYKCTAYYDGAADAGIRWDDPAFGIEWPLRDVVVSDKDQSLPLHKDLTIAKRPVYSP